MKTKKKYMAWARVSSREQKDEGFSLDVQVDAFEDYGRQREGNRSNRSSGWPKPRTKTEERKEFKADDRLSPRSTLTNLTAFCSTRLTEPPET